MGMWNGKMWNGTMWNGTMWNGNYVKWDIFIKFHEKKRNKILVNEALIWKIDY